MAELTPSFTVSSIYPTGTGGPYTGHSVSGGAGMRDSTFAGNASVWASEDGAGVDNWIRVDLGSAKMIDKIQIGPINNAFDGWGVIYISGAKIQSASSVGGPWTDRALASGHTEGAIRNYSMGVSARYWRVMKNDDYLGLGEFRIFEVDPVVNAAVVITTDAITSSATSKLTLASGLATLLAAAAVTSGGGLRIGATAAQSASAATALSGGRLRISGAVAVPVQAATVSALIEAGSISASGGPVTGQASVSAAAILPVRSTAGIATASASAVSAATLPIIAQAGTVAATAFVAGHAVLPARAAVAAALDAAGFTAEASLSRIAMLPESRLITFTQDRATDRRITLNQARSADRILQL